MSSFKEKFYTAKRRVTQKALQRLGKAQATPDDEYQERKKRVLALHAKLVSAHKHCQAYLDHTRGSFVNFIFWVWFTCMSGA